MAQKFVFNFLKKCHRQQIGCFTILPSISDKLANRNSAHITLLHRQTDDHVNCQMKQQLSMLLPSPQCLSLNSSELHHHHRHHHRLLHYGLQPLQHAHWTPSQRNNRTGNRSYSDPASAVSHPSHTSQSTQPDAFIISLQFRLHTVQ